MAEGHPSTGANSSGTVEGNSVSDNDDGVLIVGEGFEDEIQGKEVDDRSSESTPAQNLLLSPV